MSDIYDPDTDNMFSDGKAPVVFLCWKNSYLVITVSAAEVKKLREWAGEGIPIYQGRDVVEEKYLAMAESKPMYTPEEAKKFEDEVLSEIDDWSEEKKATAYWILNVNGMNMSKARQIRVKKNLSGS